MSDQGTERKLATAPLLVAGDGSIREAISMLEDGRATWDAPGVGDSKFLPEAMEHAGIRHIFFNALRECVTKQPEYEEWKLCLNELLSLLGKSEYRTRFFARNLALGNATKAARSHMSKINSSFLDWKWEHVEDLLYWVLASHPAYKGSWDVEA